VAVFTKFDGKIVQESEALLSNLENYEVNWDMARESAEIIFQKTYLPKVLNTPNPPKAYVRLEGEEHEHSLLKI
jgi:hypothetical protein